MNSLQQAQQYIAGLLNSKDPKAQAQGRVLTQMYQANPDKISILARNDALGQYADTELRRQTSQAQIDSLNKQSNDPNTTNQIWARSWQQALQQFNQAGGMMAQAQKMYEKNLGLVQQNMTSNMRGLYAQNSAAQTQLDKLSEDKRDKLTPEQSDGLSSLQNGADTYNKMSDAYIRLVQKYPWLGNPITGDAQAKLKQIQNDPDMIAYQKYSEAFQPQIARGVAGDRGTIAQNLQEKAAGAIPHPGDSIDTVNRARQMVVGQVADYFNSKLNGYQNSLMKTGNWSLMDPNDPSTLGGQTPSAGPDANGNYGADQNQQPASQGQSQQPVTQQPAYQAPSPQQNQYSSAMQVIDNWNKGNALSQAKMANQQQQALSQQQQQALQQQYQQQQNQNQNAFNLGAIAAQRGQ
jgi:hypothetical protein